MTLLLDDRSEALWRLNAIVIWQDVNRQHLLDRRPVITRATVDSLEAVVASHHCKGAATFDVSFQRTQAVRRTSAADPGVGVQQQRVGADIGEDDCIIGSQTFQRLRKVALRLVRGHVA